MRIDVETEKQKGRFDYIIVAGDSASGFHYHGPFTGHWEADSFAMENGFGRYEICELIKP